MSKSVIDVNTIKVTYDDIIQYHPKTIYNVITDNKYLKEVDKLRLFYYDIGDNKMSFWSKGATGRINSYYDEKEVKKQFISFGIDNCFYLHYSPDNKIMSYGWSNFLVKYREYKFKDLFK